MDPFFIWSYGVPLETASSRFNSASFFTYIVFVCSVVIVSISPISRLSFVLSLHHNLTYLPVQPFSAETVPEVEEDHPYISTGPSFAINPKGLLAM
jgi:hypothetical protein